VNYSRTTISAWALLAVACACGGSAASTAATTPATAPEATPPAPHTAVVDRYSAIVAAADRSEDDRALDPGRRPAELLAFIGVQPGMRVAEIMAGGGYTAELLARAVGSEGHVYGLNSPWVLDRFAQGPWSARLQKPVMANVTRLDREVDAPFPDDVRDLDAVVNVLFYHDTYWMEADRAAMNRAIYAALKPGGVYVIVDHSGRQGSGTTEVKTLHRVEESVVRAEIEAAGFLFNSDANFLRNPEDTRDWSASPGAAAERRGTSDRFVLKFKKPTATQ